MTTWQDILQSVDDTAANLGLKSTTGALLMRK